MVESTTCDAGETQCTIAFNEPVDEASAQARLSYGYTPDGFNSITLGADGRTITLGFGAGLGGADELGPAGPPGAVEDDDEQTSSQGAFDFVR